MIQEISKIIDWYYANSFEKQQNIFEVIDHRDRLAVYSYRLAELAAEEKLDSNLKHFRRKIAVARKTMQLMNEDLAHNKASDKSLIANEDYFEKEMKSEAEAYKADLLLKQVNKILEAMSQRISHLKTEEQLTKKHA